jgi:hypothetical protein
MSRIPLHVFRCELEQQRHKDDDENEIDFRDHRTVAHIRAVLVDAEDIARDRVGGAARPLVVLMTIRQLN